MAGTSPAKMRRHGETLVGARGAVRPGSPRRFAPRDDDEGFPPRDEDGAAGLLGRESQKRPHAFQNAGAFCVQSGDFVQDFQRGATFVRVLGVGIPDR